jgi:hypothetical protein
VPGLAVGGPEYGRAVGRGVGRLVGVGVGLGARRLRVGDGLVTNDGDWISGDVGAGVPCPAFTATAGTDGDASGAAVGLSAPLRNGMITLTAIPIVRRVPTSEAIPAARLRAVPNPITLTSIYLLGRTPHGEHILRAPVAWGMSAVLSLWRQRQDCHTID